MNTLKPFASTRIGYVINLLKPDKKQRVLHIGVSNIPDLEKEIEGIVRESITIDIDREKIKKARPYLSRARIIEEDITNPTHLKKNYFDVVVMLEVLEHIDDDRKTLRIIHSLLKKGGRLIMSVPNRDVRHAINPVKYFEHKRHYSSESLIAKLHEAGFEIAHFNVVESFSLLANLYLHLAMKYLFRKHVPFHFFDRRGNKSYRQYNKYGLDLMVMARKT